VSGVVCGVRAVHEKQPHRAEHPRGGKQPGVGECDGDFVGQDDSVGVRDWVGAGGGGFPSVPHEYMLHTTVIHVMCLRHFHGMAMIIGGIPRQPRRQRLRGSERGVAKLRATPEGFPNKAKGCAYSRHPGNAMQIIINPGGVAYSPVYHAPNGQPFQG